MHAKKTDLLGLTPAELEAALATHFASRDQPSYRVEQVKRWIFEGSVESIDGMSNLPANERVALAARFLLGAAVAERVSRSGDGTVKHLWKLSDGELVESVLIPAGDRLTLCISSQVGCALGCTFCGTGWAGFRRHLTTGEIVFQFRASRTWAARNDYGRISNVVYMGMGEPLSNRRALHPSLTILNQGYGLGARRVTISTVGVVPGILELAERPEQFRLAVSLHAPESEVRRQLVPLEKRHPLPRTLGGPSPLRRGRRAPHHLRIHHDSRNQRCLDPCSQARRASGLAQCVRQPHPLQLNPIPGLASQQRRAN